MTHKPLGLLDKPLLPFSSEQLNSFRLDNLHAETVRDFDPSHVSANEGKEVLAIDIGGTTIVSAHYKVEDGDVVMLGESKSFESENGKGYLTFLEEAAREAEEQGLAVGISCAGRVINGKPTFSINTREFGQDMRVNYNGDFGNLFPDYAVENDAVTGLIAGSVEAKKQFPDAKNVLYVINGSGTGAAILKSGSMIALEPGHVEATDALGTLQDKPCGAFDNSFVCVENITGGKAGIEDVWAKKAGHKMSAKEIAEIAKDGDKLASEIFSNSANGIAHLVKGVADSFVMMRNPSDTVIILHGGTFNFDEYCRRIENIFQENLDFLPLILYTKNIHHNTCMHGAAIAIITKTTQK